MGTRYQLPVSGQISMNDISRYSEELRAQSISVAPPRNAQRGMGMSNSRAILGFGQGNEFRLGGGHGTTASPCVYGAPYMQVKQGDGFYYNDNSNKSDKDNQRSIPDGYYKNFNDTRDSLDTTKGQWRFGGEVFRTANTYLAYEYNVWGRPHNSNRELKHTISFDYFWDWQGGYAMGLSTNCYIVSSPSESPYGSTTIRATIPMTKKGSWASVNQTFTSRGDLYKSWLLNFNSYFYAEDQGQIQSSRVTVRNLKFKRTQE